MSFVYRCRIFALGLTFWIINTAQIQAHYPFSDRLGLFHAMLAGMVGALAFMPRRMLYWPTERSTRDHD